MKTENLSVSSNLSDTVGSVRWMAPELFSPPTVYTQKSDIYSLGMTLWELVSRQIPFQNAVTDELIPIWVKNGEREDIPEDCPDYLASAIKACGVGDPSHRPDAEVLGNFLMSQDTDFAVFLSRHRNSGGETPSDSNADPGEPVALPPPPPPTTNTAMKPIEQLTDEEFETRLRSIRMSSSRSEGKESDVIDEMLRLCRIEEEEAELGCVVVSDAPGK